VQRHKTRSRLCETAIFIFFDLFQILVVDEAHRLKNDASLLTKTLAAGGRYRWARCLLLTGTPLQNNTDELWTLLNFVDPARFADKREFSDRFGDMSNQSQVILVYSLTNSCMNAVGVGMVCCGRCSTLWTRRALPKREFSDRFGDMCNQSQVSFVHKAFKIFTSLQ
jgi:SNF2-related domain